VGLAILGGWICLHSVLLLRFQGKGLPISALPPTCYITSGPYRIWRHPIYTGFTLLAAGLSLVLRSPGLALVVVPALATVWHLTWVRLYEEPACCGDSGRPSAHTGAAPLYCSPSRFGG